MKIDICNETKIVYYWITLEERGSNQDKLSAEYKEWSKKKYRVCTFISGKDNLTELTKELLIHNRNVLAERESTKTQINALDKCAA